MGSNGRGNKNVWEDAKQAGHHDSQPDEKEYDDNDTYEEKDDEEDHDADIYEEKDSAAQHDKDILGNADSKPEHEWLCVRAKCSQYVVFLDQTCKSPYVSVEVTGIVQRVVFTIESHDHGKSDFTEGHLGRPLTNLAVQTPQTTTSTDFQPGDGWFEAGVQRKKPEAQKLPRWPVHRKVTAPTTARKQTVVFDRKTSAFPVQCWLTAIEPGDRLSLYPQGCSPVWENHVESIEVKVFYI